MIARHWQLQRTVKSPYIVMGGPAYAFGIHFCFGGQAVFGGAGVVHGILARPQGVVPIDPPVVIASNEERVVGGIGFGGGGRHPGAMVTAGPGNFLVAVGFAPPLVEVAIGEVVGAALCYAGGAQVGASQMRPVTRERTGK